MLAAIDVHAEPVRPPVTAGGDHVVELLDDAHEQSVGISEGIALVESASNSAAGVE